MSEALAIPATTLVLKLIIEARLKLAYAPLSAPPVSVAPPPPRTAPPPAAANNAVAAAEPAGLILFMHHVAPSAAWRNMFDPHMNATGTRQGPAPVVLDLAYLLAAQGSDLEREALLGIGVSALTRNALVPRAMITALLGSLSVPPAPTRITERLPLAPLADAAQQLEQLAIAQSPMDIDVSTKLWSALQSPLRPTALFTVTTLFLNVDENFPATKPVETVAVAAVPDPVPSISLPVPP
jgi:Pvc16 N-terminal domain